MTNPTKILLMGHSSTREHFTYGYGLARVHAYARKLGLSFDCTHLDRRNDDSEDQDLAMIVEQAPNIVGLATYLWNLPRVARLVTQLRRELPHSIIVLGGPSVLGYEEALAGTPAGAYPHYAVVGEGEVPFAELVRAYQQGELAEAEKTITGIVRFGADAAVRNPDPPPLRQLDDLGSPYLLGLSQPTGDVFYWETSRGCPYLCSFCVLSTKVNKMRYFSTEFLEQELRWAMERGNFDINICDAALNYDTERLDELTRMIQRVDPDGALLFTFALHSDYLNDEQIRLLRRIRVKQTTLGLNSITPSTFKDVRRKIIPQRFAAAVKRLATITRPVVSVVMGLPGETVDGFAQTLEFCGTLEADIEIFPLQVIPETTYWERRRELKLVYSGPENLTVQSGNTFSPEDLQKMAELAADFESERGRWQKAHFTGERPSGGTVAKLRRALVHMGVLDARRPLEIDGWSLESFYASDGANAALNLIFRHVGGEDVRLILAKRTDRERCFVHTMLFNLSYASAHREPSARVLSLLKQFRDRLLTAERQCFEPPELAAVSLPRMAVPRN
jgi:radical SAM superfamily enzyme YgiQ (UPF0313 family)